MLFDGWDEVWDDAPRCRPAAGPDGLRCLAGYRALAHLADDRREGQPDEAATASAALFSAILDRLQRGSGG